MRTYIRAKGMTCRLQEEIRKDFNTPTHSVRFVPVCAFNIVYAAYLVPRDAGADWEMENQVAQILYEKP